MAERNSTLIILFTFFAMVFLLTVYTVSVVIVDTETILMESQYHQGSIELLKTQIDNVLRRPI